MTYSKISRVLPMLFQAIRITGTYDPDITLSVFFDDLTSKEYSTLYDFLKWVHLTGKKFGSGNFQETYSAWQSHTKTTDLVFA